MDNIVITGATGVVGRRAVRELVADGHRVISVTPSARGRQLIESLGAQAVEADVFVGRRWRPRSPARTPS